MSDPLLAGDVTGAVIVRHLSQESALYNRLWQPYVTRWQDELLVAFSRELGRDPRRKVDMGDVVCCRSTDGGATWSEPTVIFDSRVPVGPLRFAYANAVLFRPTGQNSVWCFAMRCPLFYVDSEDSRLCAAYSPDGGLTWQQVELAVHHHSALIIVAGIVEVQEPGRVRYLLPAHRNTRRHDPKGDCQQFVLESANLLEWRLAGYIPQAEPAAVFLHEGNIAPGDSPDELKIVMRTAQLHGDRRALEPPRAYSSVSRDGGRTWSMAQPEPELYNSVAKSFFGRDAQGRHWYVYNDGPAWERRGLYYRVKPPGGVWSAPRLFFHAHTRNSYPTLVEEATGEFLCVWDSSTDPEERRTAIRFGRLRLP